MYFVPALLFGFFSGMFYVPGFLDVPLGQLTPGALLQQILFVTFGLIALAALARSIEFDPFWPWRPGFRNFFERLFHRPH